jgi:hypothetical protein
MADNIFLISLSNHLFCFYYCCLLPGNIFYSILFYSPSRMTVESSDSAEVTGLKPALLSKLEICIRGSTCNISLSNTIYIFQHETVKFLPLSHISTNKYLCKCKTTQKIRVCGQTCHHPVYFSIRYVNLLFQKIYFIFKLASCRIRTCYFHRVLQESGALSCGGFLYSTKHQVIPELCWHSGCQQAEIKNRQNR